MNIEDKDIDLIMKALPWDLTEEERELQLAINKATLPRLIELLKSSVDKCKVIRQ